ncbi:MAG TPA: hypothetical protein VF070_03290 [Streptosporangiaceae bacterium]
MGDAVELAGQYRAITLQRGGHFDIYVGEPFERVVADQLAFLAQHVPATR